MTYPIPKSAFDDRLAIVGTAGSGKTYAALGAMAILLHSQARLVGIDPLGVMWGLRLLLDGKTPSAHDIAIFGGPHGDLPINEHAGAIIGETVATMRESCVLDLSQLGTKAAERRFMLDFLTALYRHTSRDPLHLIIDEADMWAPQRLMDKEGDAAKLLGMMETIVRRGRVRGFIPWLITQRPAVVSKDILSQADGLISLKLTSKQDRDAIGGWIEGQADREKGKAILASLPSKGRGEGVLWIPGRDILRDVAFPSNETFDSSRTPKRGEKRVTADLRPLDLGVLKSTLATVEAEAKENDPRILKAEVAKLKAQMAKAVEQRIVADPNAALRERENAFAAGRREGREAGWSEAWIAGWKSGHIAGCKAQMHELGAVALAVTPEAPKPPKVFYGTSNGSTAAFGTANTGSTSGPGTSRIISRNPAAIVPAPVMGKGEPNDELTSPQRRIMASLAFWRSVGHETPTREQVAAVAAYKPGSGNFNNLIGSLSSRGYTVVPLPGCLTLVKDYASLTADEACAKLWSIFDNPQRRLVEAALAATGDLTRDELAINAGYAPGSGNFNNICGKLTSMDVLRKPAQGRVAISDWAREVLS